MRTVLLTFTMTLVACGYDVDDLGKGEVDELAMSSGVEVVLDGALARVIVPFAAAVPEVPQEEFQDEMQGTVSLRLIDARTGAAADVMVGEIVDGDPTVVGEVACTLNEDRREATFAFHNAGGVTLESGLRYAAQFSIATNDYVARVPAMTFDVIVVN
jgi:hypothetical protein